MYIYIYIPEPPYMTIGGAKVIEEADGIDALEQVSPPSLKLVVLKYYKTKLVVLKDCKTCIYIRTSSLCAQMSPAMLTYADVC